MLATSMDEDPGTKMRAHVRWSSAGLCVLLAHAGAVHVLMRWMPHTPAPGEPPAAIMIELAPLPAAPQLPHQEAAVGPETVASDLSSAKNERAKPTRDDRVEPVQPELVDRSAQQSQALERDVPILPSAVEAETMISRVAAPDPPRETATTEAKRAPNETRPRKPQSRTSRATQAATAPKATKAQQARVNAAPTPGTSFSLSVPTWRGMVTAHLNRHKRYPGGGGGTSWVAFTIDRTGRVLSARIAHSSGSAILDREAVELTRRASPIPPPPPDISGGSIVLTVPVGFSRR